MATRNQPVDSDALSSEAAVKVLSVKVRRLFVYTSVSFCLLVASSGSLAFLFWRKAKTIDQEQKKLSFDQFVTDYNNSWDFVTPQVNTIQFLRRGYSINFDSVRYTQEGLALTGTIGNGTQLWISSLAVKFIARPYPFQIRDKWEKETFPWWDLSWDIGSGQTSVGALNPGAAVPFSVTIPNVKQRTL